MYDKGDRSIIRWISNLDEDKRTGRQTSRGGDASSEGNYGCDVVAQQLVNFIDEFPSKLKVGLKESNDEFGTTYLTPECPRMREFIRITIAPLHSRKKGDINRIVKISHRTQDSGMLVELLGSSSGRTSSGAAEEGRTPVC